MKNKYLSLWNSVAFAPENEGGGAPAPAPAPAAPAADAGSVLFPDENKPADPADAAAAAAAEPAAPAADWKEYENDPAKSEADNAAAKAEHDKTKPAAPAGDADKVPEDGKYALTMPEGVEVDQEMLDALGPEFKGLGLTNAQAQKLADKFIEIQTARTGKQAEGWSETIAKWADDAKADKDIGGAKWDGTVSSARRAVDQLGTPELKDYLNASGGGNHPELIRFMAKAGAMLKEDNPASGGAGGSGKPVDAAYTLFPTDAPKGT